jgi:Lar family restriction alleviation protein
MEKSTELKPCPFCGSENLKVVDCECVDGDMTYWVVVCQECGARGGESVGANPAKVFWNMRMEMK